MATARVFFESQSRKEKRWKCLSLRWLDCIKLFPIETFVHPLDDIWAQLDCFMNHTSYGFHCLFSTKESPFIEHLLDFGIGHPFVQLLKVDAVELRQVIEESLSGRASEFAVQIIFL